MKIEFEFKDRFEYHSDENVARKLLTIKENAEHRGIVFNLSFAKLKREMHRKKCYFTGRKFSYIERGGNTQDVLSIDRLDNDKGYTDSNIVACTSTVNAFKANLTIDEIKLMAKKL